MLDSDAGIIRIGSPPAEIPGIVESIKISDSLLIENADIQGRSGKVKVVQGWDDVAMLVTMSLIDNPGAGKTRWDSLKEITAIFKKVADNGKPEVYTVSHPMISAWGTKQLLLSSLESAETRTRRKISVSIEFVEHDSFVGIIQDRQSTAKDQASQENIAKARELMLVSDQQKRGLGQLENRYVKL
jgi:hypothetical protein